jgi:protein SCO1/2
MFPARIRRRYRSAGLMITFGLCTMPVGAHEGGQVKPPLEVPNLSVLSGERQQTHIRDLLFGRVTALQLMFTKCKSLCPIEAGILGRVEKALADYPGEDIQLLSLSIDPATDTPDALNAWLKRFHAGGRWHAVSPAQIDLARAKAFFDRPAAGKEVHSTAIFLIDRRGFLVWRTFDLPDADEVAKLLVAMGRNDQR